MSDDIKALQALSESVRGLPNTSDEPRKRHAPGEVRAVPELFAACPCCGYPNCGHDHTERCADCGLKREQHDDPTTFVAASPPQQSASLPRLQEQVEYVVSCLDRVIADAKAADTDWSMYANWRDYLTGKTFVPSEGQTWADAAKEQSASLDPVALEAVLALCEPNPHVDSPGAKFREEIGDAIYNEIATRDCSICSECAWKSARPVMDLVRTTIEAALQSEDAK